MKRYCRIACMTALLTLAAALPAPAASGEATPVYDPLVIGHISAEEAKSGAWDGWAPFPGAYGQGKWLYFAKRPVLVRGKDVAKGEELCVERQSDDETIVAVSELLPAGLPLVFHAPDGTKIATAAVEYLKYECTDMDGMWLNAKFNKIELAPGAKNYTGPIMGRLPSSKNTFMQTQKTVSDSGNLVSYTTTDAQGKKLEMRFVYKREDDRDTYVGTLLFEGKEFPSYNTGWGEESEDKETLLKNMHGYFIDLNSDGTVEFLDGTTLMAFDGKKCFHLLVEYEE